MAKIGSKARVMAVAKAAVKPVAVVAKNPHIHNPGTSCILRPQMVVYGQFKRIKGFNEKHGNYHVRRVLDFLDSCNEGAEFVGYHGGRKVIAVKRRVCTTIVFTDSYSKRLPPLPSTQL